MTNSWEYRKGLHDVGNGIYAYLLPDGSWGWSNAGLICDGEESLLVDTLFDRKLTAEMLNTMKDATGIGGDEVTILVNTHANGDHTFGNSLVTKAEIIASAAGAKQMAEDIQPEDLAALMREAPNMGETGAFLLEIFSDFTFDDIELRLPTKTFEREMSLTVGDKAVQLINVGPAHTEGDTLVYVPDDKVIYTGDILFIDGTPIIWAGPVSNWINACDRMLAMDIDVVVPGHGPITDKAGVKQVRDYLTWLKKEAHVRYMAGQSFEEAANDIVLGEYGNWSDSERIVINVYTLYREFTDAQDQPDVMTLFGLMAKYHYRQKETQPPCSHPDHHH